jgi:hypothetical protein
MTNQSATTEKAVDEKEAPHQGLFWTSSARNAYVVRPQYPIANENVDIIDLFHFDYQSS